MVHTTDFACQESEDDVLDVTYRPTGRTYRFRHVRDSRFIALQSAEGQVGSEPEWLVGWMARSVAYAFVHPKLQMVETV